MSDVEGLVSRLVAVLTALAEKMSGQKGLPSILTPQRVALELSCSVSKVRAMIREGELATVRVGGRLGVPSREIERLLGPSPDRNTIPSLPHRKSKSEADTELVKAAIRKDNKKRR